jgi:hypothetical protein
MIKSSSSMLPSVESGSRETSFVIPNDILELLGPPPLIATEEPSRFQALVTRFAVEFDPKTTTEWFLVNDLVNVNWEILRYRRAKTVLVQLACPAAASDLIDDKTFREFSQTQLKPQPVVSTIGRPKERKELARYGLTVEDVFDSALIAKIEEIERFDKLIERLENRREKLYREFHAHRSLNPETAKQKTNVIVDQFESDAA